MNNEDRKMQVVDGYFIVSGYTLDSCEIVCQFLSDCVKIVI